MSGKQLEDYLRKMKAYADQITVAPPKASIDSLIRIGIIDNKGKIRKPYC